MSALETRTVALTAKQWQFLTDLLGEYRHEQIVSSAVAQEEGRPEGVRLAESDAAFAEDIQNSIRSAGA